MSEETQRRIFTQFYTTKPDGAGFGLGLYTAREIIAQHGGVISVESAPGKGSRFTIQLPALDPELGVPAMATGEREAPRFPARPSTLRTVLLVDDEAMIRRSMARLLKRSGFEVREAASGEEAVKLYANAAPDLVLLDLNMPGLDGEQTQQRLTAIDPDVRIVFATGDAHSRRENVLRARGALGVLEKPYTLDALFDILAQHAPAPSGR